MSATQPESPGSGDQNNGQVQTEEGEIEWDDPNLEGPCSKGIHPFLLHSQFAVEHDYRQSCGLNSHEFGNLHMFFSPRRIPLGLTDIQIRVCVGLYPLVEAKKARLKERVRLRRRKIEIERRGREYEDPVEVFFGEVLDLTITGGSSVLPRELLEVDIMNAEIFSKGIQKLLETIND